MLFTRTPALTLAGNAVHGYRPPPCGYERACFGIQEALRKLRSSVEAVFGWESYLYIMGELPDAKN